MNNVTIDELRQVVALSDLPDDQLQWILDRSDYMEYQEGDVIIKNGEAVDSMWIVIEGSAAFYMILNGQQVYFITFENSVESGGVTGLLPYSRMKTSKGNAYALAKCRWLGLHKKHFGDLEKLNPEFVQRLIAYMMDRARVFATVQLQHEKVSALGKLSAGIAHELNNPASAIHRFADELNERLNLNFDLTKKLLMQGVQAESIDAVHDLVQNSILPKVEVRIDAKKRIQLEDRFQEWLEEKGVDDNQDLYESFIDSGVTIEDLESVYNLVNGSQFGVVIRWFCNLVSSRNIIKDLGLASERISKLVGAIKSHVHMDRMNDVQPTNVITDIENTLMLLGHKLREKDISIERKFPDNFPEVDAYVGELNQVWMNVLDNAIYAMGKNGKLKLEACIVNNDIRIKISDDGQGIPSDVLPRIFDPFFSTKKVGDGTGIGLDIVNRVIKKHNGEIKVSSVPGCTQFNICIPIHQVIRN